MNKNNDRYMITVDADKIVKIELLERGAGKMKFLEEINNKLRTENEKLKEQIETVKKVNEQLTNPCYVRDIENRVARYIFTELESLLCYSIRPKINADGTITPVRSSNYNISCDDYNTLRKKYTENQDK